MSIQTIRLCDKCGDIINADLDSSDSVQLTYVSGKRVTAYLCPSCFEELLHGMNITWIDVEEEVIVPLPEPEPKPVEETIPGEPETAATEEEAYTIEEEPEDDCFDNLDDAILLYLGQGHASVSQISEHFGISKHDTVCILERLRRKGMTAKAAGRYMWKLVGA